mgnify:CR=1 FL=1
MTSDLRQCALHLFDKAVDAGAVLAARLIAITGANPDIRIFLRGDRSIGYGRVMQVMSTINRAGFKKVALITDGRFSGATRGFCVGHVGPEAAHGGPIALLKNGDMITLDAITGSISVDLSDDELAKRRKDWAGPRETNYQSGALWKYAKLVGPTYLGAVTHPGAQAETHDYMDL